MQFIHDRQAEKHLQVMKRERCRYIGLKKSICNNEYQGIADTTVAIKASATANIKSVQIQQLPQRHLQQRISEMCRYMRCQKSESFCLPIYFNHSIPKSKKKTMHSSESESGMPDEAEQECIVFSCFSL